ncbi:putative membrane protein [Granulicella aggregans]|uniref:Putative membrane protein n=1 Tax=Granulicella aggregans TaxID=474949 RepID=A0A7W7ZED5_9BACT|nr:DUF4149 domain-containing protein [Granulicella aggregans]MBB5057806.1 putative membrane protein [Granulicella aggregans]
MPTLIRFLRLLSIVVWVGGIIFFAFVLAPVAFSVLPSQHQAGSVVGGALRVLDILGLVSGAIFWLTTVLLFRESDPAHKRRYEIQLLLSAVMLLATAYLHAGILPAMEQDRVQSGGDIEAAAKDNPAKMHFEQLHKRSERLEGAILFLGLGLVLLIARESPPQTQ